jgi:hypothetical protein
MRYSTIQNTALAMVCAILLGFAGAVSADEIPEPKSVAEELLEILRAAGTIDDTQYRENRSGSKPRSRPQLRRRSPVQVKPSTRPSEPRRSHRPTRHQIPSPIPRIGNSGGAMASSSIATTGPSSSSLAAAS